MDESLIRHKIACAVADYFREWRFDEAIHIGSGDIRMTIAMQNELCEIIEDGDDRRSTTQPAAETANDKADAPAGAR